MYAGLALGTTVLVKHQTTCTYPNLFYAYLPTCRLLLFLLVLSAPGYAFASGPRLDGLDELETKQAELYWSYAVCDRVVLDRSTHSPPGSYRFFIPLAQRLAGATYVGHAARLRLALEKARREEILRVGALGGSITAGQGVGAAENTYFKMFLDWLNCALPARRVYSPPGAGATLGGVSGTAAAAADGADAGGQGGGKGGQGFSRRRAEAAAAAGDEGGELARGTRRRLRLLEGVEEPGSQNSSGVRIYGRHKHINGAVPGTDSSYTSSCLHNHLIPDPDLVFVEYAVNDLPVAVWKQDNPPRRAFERLIRKLLRLPSRPAVVLVNMFAFGPSHGKYFYTAERDFMEFATYYGLPAVSLKAAVLPRLYVGTTEQLSKGGIWNGGLNHPGRGGHVVVTELLVTLCLNLLRTTAEFAGGGGDTPAAAAARSNSFLSAGGAAAAEALAELAVLPLPPPMAEGNYETMEKTCYIEAELQSLVQQPVVDWNWTDEGRGKWGYVAMGPDKMIYLKVSTRLVGDRPQQQAEAEIILQVAYLQSYRGMGTARVSCESGCSCDQVTVDGYDPRPVSLTMMKDVKVSQHPECVIKIISGPPSKKAKDAADDGGDDTGDRGASAPAPHKFKLMGLVVGEEPGARQGAVEYVRGESHALWQRTSKGAAKRPV